MNELEWRIKKNIHGLLAGRYLHYIIPEEFQRCRVTRSGIKKTRDGAMPYGLRIGRENK